MKSLPNLWAFLVFILHLCNIFFSPWVHFQPCFQLSSLGSINACQDIPAVNMDDLNRQVTHLACFIQGLQQKVSRIFKSFSLGFIETLIIVIVHKKNNKTAVCIVTVYLKMRLFCFHAIDGSPLHPARELEPGPLRSLTATQEKSAADKGYWWI